MMRKSTRVLGIVVLALGLFGLRARPADAAAPLTVSTCDESHLAAAVSQANTDDAGDTISFSCDGTITLTSTLVITGGMTISGAGQTVVIDGGGNIEMLHVIHANLDLKNLTLSNGHNDYAAALYDQGGTLNIDSTTFSDNVAAAASGGAIYVEYAVAHISGSTFENNSAVAGGGAIENNGGQVIIVGGSFTNNIGTSGGAINNQNGGTLSVSNGTAFSSNLAALGNGGAIESDGQITVTEATFHQNTAPSRGGAIHDTGTTKVTDSVFSHNSTRDANGGSGGAIDVNGNLTVTRDTFSDNSSRSGGALATPGTPNIMHVVDSTFINNRAGQGQTSGDAGAISEAGPATITGSSFLGNSSHGTAGAIENRFNGLLTIANSTFYNNQSGIAGGAIFTYGSATVTNSTLAGNSAAYAGGALLAFGGTTSFAGSILSGNTVNGSTDNCNTNSGQGAIGDGHYNLEDGTDCGFTGTGDIQSVDPLLDASGPQNNGGPTNTIALQSTSPALDQIPLDSGLCPAGDQRGYARPDDSGTETSCDMGAYEFDAPTPAATALSQVSGSSTYGGGATLTATLKDANDNLLGGETVRFTVGSTPVCDVPGEPSCPQTGTSDGSLGVATVTGVTLPVGVVGLGAYPGSVYARFDGDVGYAASTASGDLTIGTADTSTSASSKAVMALGKSFTVDYTVASAFGVHGNTATGQASFVQDSGPGTINCSPSSVGISADQNSADGTGASDAGFGFTVNSSTNSGDEFICTPDTLGSYTYHVDFQDTDGNYAGSDSDTLNLTVVDKLGTTLSSVSGSAIYGGTATFAATLKDENTTALSGKPVAFTVWTGTWTDLCGGSTGVTCPTTDSSGVASLSSVTLPAAVADAGTYTGDVRATFAADTDYTGSTGDGTLTVSPADQSITFDSLGDKTYGDPDFDVSATASSGLTVAFGASDNCTVTGVSVHLTGAGSCTITASQSGTSNYNAADDVPQTFSIGKGSTTTSLGSSLNPSVVGGSVTYTATISPALGDGTVAFKDGGSAIGCETQAVTGGQATCAVSYGHAGIHSITATYSGDANYTGSSTISALTQTVSYTIHVVSTSSLKIVLQLWNSSHANISASALPVTAKCVVSSATVPTGCGTRPLRSINARFTYGATGKKYSYQLSSSKLTKHHSYYLMVQAVGDPVFHAVKFTY